MLYDSHRVEPPLPPVRLVIQWTIIGVRKGGKRLLHSQSSVGLKDGWGVESRQPIIHAQRASGHLTGPEERLCPHPCYKNRNRVVTELTAKSFPDLERLH